MVSIMQKVKVGPKGQIVIPKIFRENLGIVPGRDILLGYENNKLIIQKSGESIVDAATRIAKGRINKFTAKQLREMAYD